MVLLGASSTTRPDAMQSSSRSQPPPQSSCDLEPAALSSWPRDGPGELGTPVAVPPGVPPDREAARKRLPLPPWGWYAGMRPVPLETGAAVLAEPAAARTVERSRACHGEFRTAKTGNATPPKSEVVRRKNRPIDRKRTVSGRGAMLAAPRTNQPAGGLTFACAQASGSKSLKSASGFRAAEAVRMCLT
jgi:hypothetical protein